MSTAKGQMRLCGVLFMSSVLAGRKSRTPFAALMAEAISFALPVIRPPENQRPIRLPPLPQTPSPCKINNINIHLTRNAPWPRGPCIENKTPFALAHAALSFKALPVIRPRSNPEGFFHDSPPQTPPLGKEIYYYYLAKVQGRMSTAKGQMSL